MTTSNMPDPFAAAVEAGEQLPRYFGEINLFVQFVNLEKGSPKTAWDAQSHKTANRRTEVEFTILPLVESGMVNTLQRSVIAESSEWTKILWPSLRALGVKDGNDLRTLHGKFAAVEFAATGRKYTDKKTGEERESTTLKFLAIYPDEATATAAWRNERGGASSPTSQPQATAPVQDPERATVVMFLPALAKQANYNEAQMAAIIAANPMISKHFSINSPEVQALMVAPF